MLDKKAFFGLVFILLVSFVLADGNVSIQYGWNGSDYVPFKTTSDGTLKTDINKANFTSELVSVGTNLTVGGGTIQFNTSGGNFIYNNGTGWYQFATSGSAPVDAVMAFNRATCPTGWALADGTSGTPDLRGIFIRGAGTSGRLQMANGSYMSATYGVYSNDSFQEHYHKSAMGSADGQDPGLTQRGSTLIEYGTEHVMEPLTAGAAYGTPRTGAETAPASYAMIYCVKTEVEDSNNGLFQLVGTVISLFNSSYVLDIDSDVNISGTLNLGNGSIWYNDSDEKYYYYNKTAWLDIGSGSGSGESTEKSYTQTSHGLSVGDAVYYNGSGHYKAIANDSAKLGTGIVSFVSGDSFDVTYSGYISGLSGLTTGSYYYVSPTTAGALSVTSGSNYSNPLLQATSSTTGIVYNWRAVQLSTGNTAVWENVSGTATYAAGDVNITENLIVGGNISGGSPVKILNGFQVHNESGEVQFLINKSTGEVKIPGTLNVTGNYTQDTHNYVYNGSDWVGAKSDAEGIQHIFLNDSSRKYDAVPENAVMSFNQAECPIGWSLADGTSGTVNLTNQFVNGEQVMKQYYANSSDGPGSFNITGSNWKTIRGVAIPYKTKDGTWRMKFNILGATDADALKAISISGAYSKNVSNLEQAVTAVQGSDTSIYAIEAEVDSDFAPIFIRYRFSSTVTSVIISGDVELDSKPTWADADASLIYCVKTAEDSPDSNSIWTYIGDVVQLANATKKLVVRANGVGIDTLTNFDEGANLTTDYNDELVTLNSSASGDAVFVLPSVDSSNDGEIYRFLNDAEYTLTIKPNGTDAIWNSGSGYGIDLPDKGTMVALRYDSSRNKWDILQKTGGKVLIEGLVLDNPMSKMDVYQWTHATTSGAQDLTEKHNGFVSSGTAGIIRDWESNSKFPPGSYRFDGTDDHIYYVDSTDWDIFGDQTGHKTVAFWVYHDDISAGVDEHIISHYENGTNRFEIYTGTVGVVGLYRNNNGEITNPNGGTISDDTWTHVALVIDGSEVGVYINGAQVAYDGSWNTGAISGNLYIGQRGDNNYYLDGRMQDLHISYNNPYNANPNSGSTDSFTVPAAPFRGVMG